MQKSRLVAGAVAVAVLVLVGIWLLTRGDKDPAILELHGNIDVRQVSLAFEESGRISKLAVEEGDTVRAGDVVARLDTTTLALQAAQAEAQVKASEDNLRQLRNGSRPEEIAQANEARVAAEADATSAAQDLARLREVASRTAGQGVSGRDLDAAQSAVKAARARAEEAAQAATLARKGPREEQVAAASAQLEATKAQLALLKHRVEMGVLRAPGAGVVRARLREVGDMASPQQPVLDIALLSPKWVRVYVSETELGRIRPGMAAQVTSDSAPDRPVAGRIGYISSVAEFTPKSVETEDLRTALVYEVRIVIADGRDALRLGQPVTVRLDTGTGK